MSRELAIPKTGSQRERTNETGSVSAGDELDAIPDEEACMLLKHSPTAHNLEEIIRSCKCHSLILGLVIGWFVQLSSMGAFYLYAAFHDVTLSPSESTKNRVLFSIAWAALTSGLGVLLMAILALFFQKQQQRHVSSNFEATFLYNMECYVSAGTVAGVSLAWTIKNVWLGGSLDLWQSLALLGVAWVYSCVARCLLLSPMDDADETSENDNDMAQPLLPDQPTGSHISFRKIGLALGLLVGCLIQLSSLGANYLLDQFFHENRYHQGRERSRRNHILCFTMLWSVFTSSLGVVVLVLLRRLLKMFWSVSTADNGDGGGTPPDVLSRVELFFAIGAVVGVNLSWYVSDSLVGVNTWDPKILLTWLLAAWTNAA